jgi:hypothetical protein
MFAAPFVKQWAMRRYGIRRPDVPPTLGFPCLLLQLFFLNRMYDRSFRDKIKKASQGHNWRGFTFQ